MGRGGVFVVQGRLERGIGLAGPGWAGLGWGAFVLFRDG